MITKCQWKVEKRKTMEDQMDIDSDREWIVS